MPRRVYISKYRPDDEASVRAIEPEFFDWYSHKIDWGTIFVARHDTRVVGFLFIVWHHEPAYFDPTVRDFGEIDEVQVHRDYRNRGVGTALVKHALREAAHRRCKAVYLETDDFNRAARTVYERCGFRYHNLVIRYKRTLSRR